MGSKKRRGPLLILNGEEPVRVRINSQDETLHIHGSEALESIPVSEAVCHGTDGTISYSWDDQVAVLDFDDRSETAAGRNELVKDTAKAAALLGGSSVASGGASYKAAMAKNRRRKQKWARADRRGFVEAYSDAREFAKTWSDDTNSPRRKAAFWVLGVAMYIAGFVAHLGGLMIGLMPVLLLSSVGREQNLDFLTLLGVVIGVPLALVITMMWSMMVPIGMAEEAPGISPLMQREGPSIDNAIVWPIVLAVIHTVAVLIAAAIWFHVESDSEAFARGVTAIVMISGAIIPLYVIPSSLQKIRTFRADDVE